MKKILLLVISLIVGMSSLDATNESSDNKKTIITGVVISAMGLVAIVLTLNKWPKKQSQDAIPVNNLPSGQSNLPSDKDPEITHFSWGNIRVKYADGTEVEYGENHKFKDCKITPEGSVGWDWKQDGTRHQPGITIKAVEPIMDKANEIILSTGVHGVLQVPQATLSYIAKAGKIVHVRKSDEAVELYNLVIKENKRIAILLHSTC